MTMTLAPPDTRADADPVEHDCRPAVRRAPAPSARAVTALIVVGPFIALAVGVPLLWGQVISLRDVVIGVVLYVISGFGISVGYHRCFTHRSFRPNRPLKVVLAGAGSMAVEGSLIGWVAAHRRHHRFSDREGDPHSPDVGVGAGRSRLKGLLHAHVGWLFSDQGTEQGTADLRADRDLVWISRYWALFAIGSLVLPFLLGWGISGTVAGGLQTFLWAGLVRMTVLQHTTWSINSICHTFGRRPFRTRDRSSNVGLLSVLSLGESYHNFHHACPVSARHGVLPRQIDSSAALIRLFERAGWVDDVKWPTQPRIDHLRAR